MFGRPYRITEHSLEKKDGKVFWKAGHDAYMKFPTPVGHVRQVEVDFNESKIEIIDALTADRSYLAELFLHFHPECAIILKGATATIKRRDVSLEISFYSHDMGIQGEQRASSGLVFPSL